MMGAEVMREWRALARLTRPLWRYGVWWGVVVALVFWLTEIRRDVRGLHMAIDRAGDELLREQHRHDRLELEIQTRRNNALMQAAGQRFGAAPPMRRIDLEAR